MTAFYPSDYEPYRTTFIHKWVKQMCMSGAKVEVLRCNGATVGTCLWSLSQMSRYLSNRRETSYTWDGTRIRLFSTPIGLPERLLGYKVNHKAQYRMLKRTLAEVYSEFKFNLIYLPMCGSLSAVAVELALEMNIPYVSSVIGGDVNCSYDKPESAKFEEVLYICAHSGLVVCVSKDLENKVKRMAGEGTNTMTFYAGVDTTRFRCSQMLRSEYRRRLGLSQGDAVVVFVGNMLRAKGIYELMEAFAQLVRQSPSAKLLMVGKQIETRQMGPLLWKKGLRGRVIFTGGVREQEIPGYLNAGDIFAFPSWMEGLPNAVMEACACELPVIASNVGGIPELIYQRETGILIPPRHVEALRREMENLIRLPELRCSLGKAARLRVERDFSYHKNGGLLLRRMAAILPPMS